jgi:hypothetical protein
VNVVEQTDEEDSESERESEMSSSELILSDIQTDKRASFVSPNNFCYFY